MSTLPAADVARAPCCTPQISLRQQTAGLATVFAVLGLCSIWSTVRPSLGALDDRRPQVHRHDHPACQRGAHPSDLAVSALADAGQLVGTRYPHRHHRRRSHPRSGHPCLRRLPAVGCLLPAAFAGGLCLRFRCRAALRRNTRLYRAALFPIVLIWFVNPIPHIFNVYVDLPLQRVSAHVARAFAIALGQPLSHDQLSLMFTPRLRHVHRARLQRHPRRRHHGLHRSHRWLRLPLPLVRHTSPSSPAPSCSDMSSTSSVSASSSSITSLRSTSHRLQHQGRDGRLHHRWLPLPRSPRFFSSTVIHRLGEYPRPHQAPGAPINPRPSAIRTPPRLVSTAMFLIAIFGCYGVAHAVVSTRAADRTSRQRDRHRTLSASFPHRSAPTPSSRSWNETPLHRACSSITGPTTLPPTEELTSSSESLLSSARTTPSSATPPAATILSGTISSPSLPRPASPSASAPPSSPTAPSSTSKPPPSATAPPAASTQATALTSASSTANPIPSPLLTQNPLASHPHPLPRRDHRYHVAPRRSPQATDDLYQHLPHLRQPGHTHPSLSPPITFN